jgi:hypothetical protein
LSDLFQADISEKAFKAGLGLAISKAYVELGWEDIDEKRKGKATFYTPYHNEIKKKKKCH